jgi:uncharacterized RDD family membrane protein YckC
MSYLRDQLSIETPELVSLEFPLAGLGSRFLALLVDYLLQIAALLVLLMATLFGPGSRRYEAAYGKWLAAGLILAVFLFNWGYFVLFEAFWAGQTPGKRAAGIRVIQLDGRPLSLFESMARNLLRVLDILPGPYAVGAIAIFVTRRNQRLGDLVAGTLVVHEGTASPAPISIGHRMITPGPDPPASPLPANRLGVLPLDLVARLSGDDLRVIETFLDRRMDLDDDIRRKLAERLAARIRHKMKWEQGAESGPESFLEAVAVHRRSARGLRS